MDAGNLEVLLLIVLLKSKGQNNIRCRPKMRKRQINPHFDFCSFLLQEQQQPEDNLIAAQQQHVHVLQKELTSISRDKIRHLHKQIKSQTKHKRKLSLAIHSIEEDISKTCETNQTVVYHYQCTRDRYQHQRNLSVLQLEYFHQQLHHMQSKIQAIQRELHIVLTKIQHLKQQLPQEDIEPDKEKQIIFPICNAKPITPSRFCAKKVATKDLNEANPNRKHCLFFEGRMTRPSSVKVFVKIFPLMQQAKAMKEKQILVLLKRRKPAPELYCSGALSNGSNVHIIEHCGRNLIEFCEVESDLHIWPIAFMVVETLFVASQMKISHGNIEPYNICMKQNKDTYLVGWGDTVFNFKDSSFQPPESTFSLASEVYTIGVLFRWLVGKKNRKNPRTEYYLRQMSQKCILTNPKRRIELSTLYLLMKNRNECLKM